jgi:hypothetical protein
MFSLSEKIFFLYDRRGSTEEGFKLPSSSYSFGNRSGAVYPRRCWYYEVIFSGFKNAPQNILMEYPVIL